MGVYHLTESDIEPLLEGLAILGTGGGGSPEWGRNILKKDFREGRQITLIDVEDVDDEALIISGGIMGSVKILDSMDTEEVLARWEQRFEVQEAAQAMANYLGRNVDYVVPFEVGGLNTPVILSLAARMGIATINGDALGRSAPETQMTSFIGHGISLTPMPLADAEGNVIIVTDQVKSVFADQIGRWMITQGGGMGGNSHYPMSGAQIKKAVVPGTITKALAIGRVLRAAREQGQNAVATVVAEVQGLELFQGEVTLCAGEDRGGFYITNVELSGEEKFAGRTAKLVIKNETMALWIDGAVKAIFPDAVYMLNPQNGAGIMSTDIAVGKKMVLIGQPCHPRLREALQNSVAAEAFGGARYGHPELHYVPMEELNPELKSL